MIALPAQSRGAPWPGFSADGWPVGPAPEGPTDVLARAFSEPQPPEWGTTFATLVVQGGRLVTERYGPDTRADSPLLSWSMAKSMTHALAGVSVGRGEIDLSSPAKAPEWKDPCDPRHAITVDHLLRMSDGLAFVEDYVDDTVSDVIEMLFGTGQHDVAHFAADRPLAATPGAAWNYSSGTTNILARMLGVTPPSIARDLFEPIGMSSATARFDDAGTFIGSSFVYASARDFARFGLLYLRDGMWAGHRILPEGWVDYARTPAPACPTDEYGAHWWLRGDRWGTFSAQGYEGQYLWCVPVLDLIVVRLGKTPAALRPGVEGWLDEIVAAYGDV